MKIEIEIPDDELKEMLTNVISKRLYDDYRCDCGEQHTWETDDDFCSYGERL